VAGLTDIQRNAIAIYRSRAFWTEPKDLLLTLGACCLASLTQGKSIYFLESRLRLLGDGPVGSIRQQRHMTANPLTYTDRMGSNRNRKPRLARTVWLGRQYKPPTKQRHLDLRCCQRHPLVFCSRCRVIEICSSELFQHTLTINFQIIRRRPIMRVEA